jgi:hypothetical protein
MNQIKRESLFMQLLESVNPKDAELFIAAKDKSMKFKGITKKLVMETFPNLIRK